MSLELVKKDIDGHTYEFEQFGAKKSTKMLIRIGRIAGKPLSLIGAEMAKGKEEGIASLNSAAVISELVGSLTERLEEDEALAIIETLTSENVLCDGKKIHSFDHHFQQRLDHMLRVFWAALEVQYGNFFGALLGALPAPTPKPPVSNRAPRT